MNIPRSEYPRPQLIRNEWINLNGKWEFEIDNSKVGEDKEYYKRTRLDSEIIVPFCPESELSGVNNKDFMNCVWYRKDIEIPANWKGKNVILHFGAVDYHAIVYVNGEKVGEHKGGYASFSFDITKFIKENDNYITLCAYDDIRSMNQPGGKQSSWLESHGCYYTRTTGIWQTVWLECVDNCYVKSIKMEYDIDTPCVYMDVELKGDFIGSTINAEAFWDEKSVGKASVKTFSNIIRLCISLSEKHLWEVGAGNLYDAKITVEKNGKIYDEVTTYFGLRTVCLDKKAFKLNGKTVFGRWVLDQGFYPDGIYTAPTDEDLKKDILYSMNLGFNGARLHEKVFEPRYLYWADKLGYLVWGEYASWGLNISEMKQIEHFLPEWVEVMERDYNHPSLIGWCPFNETWDKNGKKQCDMIVKMVYDVTKALDKTRPVIDTSGNFHIVTDIFDVHDYEQDPEELKEYYSKISEGILNDQCERHPLYKNRQFYKGEPTFVSEYGGIKLGEDGGGWGYGNAPKTEEEFIERYKGLTEVLLANPDMLGFCYTQLYDVEQEVNGLMTYDRKYKIDPETIKKINEQKAAIELIENESVIL